MSLNNVPRMLALVYGSPKKNGAGAFDQLPSSKPGARRAPIGSDASASPLRKSQFEFEATNVTRGSYTKRHVLLVAVPMNALGSSARSKIPWFVTHVTFTVVVPLDGGVGTLNT